MDGIDIRALALGAAFALGIGFGGIARWSAFCVRGAVEDVLTKPDAPRLRGYLLALVVALVGTQALAACGIVDIGKSIYLTGALPLGGALLGGLMFGVGMVLAGGCGGRLLVLAAGGNLRSLIVLMVMGLAAYATLRGILAIPRQSLAAATGIEPKALGLADQGLGTLLAARTGLSNDSARWLAVVLLVVPALAFVARRRVAARHLVGGALIGAFVVAGFAVTGWLGNDEFQPLPVESLTVTGPVAQTIVYALTYTGSTLDFGIAVTLGIPLGAFLVAALRGELRLQGFENANQTARYLLGGVLMGVGGVLSMGCTIGQGLTGVATLSMGSFAAILAIFSGAAPALSWTRVAAALRAARGTSDEALAAVSHL